MGGLFSRSHTAAAPYGEAFDLEEQPVDGSTTSPIVELDGNAPLCSAENELAPGCTGLVESAAQLQLLVGPDATVKVGHGEWWITHVYHAAFCSDDEEYKHAALAGLRQWQRSVQTRPRLSRWPL